MARSRETVRFNLWLGCCLFLVQACGAPVGSQSDPGLDLPFDLEKADWMTVISKPTLDFGTVEQDFKGELEYHAFTFYALPDSTIRISTQDASGIHLGPEDQARDLDIRVYGPGRSNYLPQMKAEGTYDVGNPGHASVTIDLPDQGLRVDGMPSQGCMYRVLVNTLNNMHTGHYALTLECIGGQCTCEEGATCAVGCVDLQSDYHNCGACGNSCDIAYTYGDGVQVCQQGECVLPCVEDEFEPNDDSAHPYHLSLDEESHIEAHLCDGEEDWFEIDLAEWDSDDYHPWLELSYLDTKLHRHLKMEVYDAGNLAAPFVTRDTFPSALGDGLCIDPTAHGKILVRVTNSSYGFVGMIPYELRATVDILEQRCFE